MTSPAERPASSDATGGEHDLDRAQDAGRNEVDQTPAIPAFVPLCAVFRRFLKSRDLKYTQERADVLDAIIARDGAFEIGRAHV